MIISPLSLKQFSLKMTNLPTVLLRRRFAPLRDEWYESLWKQVSMELGGEFDRAENLSRIRLGRAETYAYHADLMLDDAITNRIMANKLMTYRMMSKKKIPCPEYRIFSHKNLDPARELLAKNPGGIAVKPAAGTGGGLGVSTTVRTTSQLVKAVRYARSYGRGLLAEPMLFGDCFRLLYLNGKFLHAVKRERPTVIGDGSSTLGELVKKENNKRLHSQPISALSPLTIDQDCKAYLTNVDSSIRYKPMDGERVVVKNVVNENAARDNHGINNVNPEIIAAGGQLALDLNVKLAGLDVVSTDISAPLLDQKSIFHEINTSPGLHHHYLVATNNGSTDVATQIVRSMFESGQGVVRLD